MTKSNPGILSCMNYLVKNPIFKKLLDLELDPNDYAVFGSGPMYPHHLKEMTHDIDIIARGKAWKKAQQFGIPHATDLHQGLQVDVAGGKIQIFNKWISDNWDVDELIDSAEIIDGIRFVRLDLVLKSKEEQHRKKDIADIQLIQEYLKKENGPTPEEVQH